MIPSKLKYVFVLSIALFAYACSENNNGNKKSIQPTREYFEIIEANHNDTIFRVPRTDYSTEQKFCYINQKNDTIIPYGKFYMSFRDTIVDYGIVIQKTEEAYEMIGINQKGQRLYEIHWFDNGPDLMSDNTFRIIRNGKIGYADKTGNIIIDAQYACAYPFENGLAKVTYKCDKLKQNSMPKAPKSDAWFYINKKGEKVK